MFVFMFCIYYVQVQVLRSCLYFNCQKTRLDYSYCASFIRREFHEESRTHNMHLNIVLNITSSCIHIGMNLHEKRVKTPTKKQK